MGENIIFLHEYRAGESSKAFNIPQKLRVSGNQEFVRIWKVGLANIQRQLVSRLTEQIKQDDFFLYASPATKKEHEVFIKDLKNIISINFPNSIDISNSFIEQEKLNATLLNKRLPDEELIKKYTLEIENAEEGIVLLIDDVYSNGNTLRAMELAVLSKFGNRDIIKAVVLKTSK